MEYRSTAYNQELQQLITTVEEITPIWKSAVETVNDLPVENNQENEARIVLSNNRVWVYKNNTWSDQGLMDLEDLITSYIMQGLS